MKKLYFALCAMLISIGTLTATTYNNVLIDGIYYNLNDNYCYNNSEGIWECIQYAEVTSNPNKYSGNITIPDSVEYEGVKFAVKAIGQSAFQDCSNLTRVVLPESITNIGSSAFNNCGSLLSINIPEGVTAIGDYAFQYCNSLSAVRLPNSLTQINYRVFSNCSNLRSVKLPNNLQTIGDWAFFSCSRLDSITLPSSITSIGGYAFYVCYALQYANITDLGAWCNIAFGDEASNPFQYAHHLHLNGEEITELVIPTDVTSIKQYAFRGCSFITSVVIPDNVQSVEGNAFLDCYNLSSVSLGANIANLNKDAFSSCTSLKSVNWDITDFIDFAAYTLSPFYNLRNQITSFTFGENVQHIPAFMCYEMSNLSRIDIPASVTSVGEGAFAFCGRLTEINAAAGSPLYSSEEGVLFNKNKTALIIYPAGKTATSYIVPNGVQTIEENAFYGCTNLSSITIPASVTSIGAGNGTIPMWSFEGVVPATITENAFPSDVYIIVDDADTYKTAWPEYASRIFPRQYAEQTLNLTAQHDKSSLHLAVGEDNLANVIKLTISGTINSYDLMIMRNKMINLRELDLTNASIEANAYEYYTGICSHADTLITHSFRGLVSLKLPTTLKYVTNAVEDCTNLKYLEINGGVVGPNMAASSGLEVVLNAGVTDINADAFKGKTGLKKITINAPITTISNNSFSGCTGLLEVILPATLETIGDNAFSNTSIASIVFPANVMEIGSSAFAMGGGSYYYYNGNSIASGSRSNTSSNPLTKVRFEPASKLQSIGTYAFYGCSIDTLVVPDSVQTIGAHAFCNNKKLKFISFSDASKMTSIGTGVFQQCNSLDSLRLPASLKSIGELAFSIHSLTDVDLQLILPEAVETIEKGALYGRAHMSKVAFPNKLKSIAREAFRGCAGLTYVTFPTSLQTIGDYAFNGCTNLDEIRVPSSLLGVGDHAFDNCSNVTKVYTYTVEPVSIDQNTFSCWHNADLYVPSTSYYNYYYNTQWSQFLSLRQFDEEYTYFYINNDYELGGNTGTIDGKPDADLNEESGLIITGDEVQQVGTITLLGDENGAASIIACEDNLSADSLVVRLITKKGSWNYFCFPFDLLLSQLYYPFAYVIREYDGATRAQYGAGGWTDMVGNMLHKGLGYIFQGARTDTIEITIANPHIDCQDYVQEIQAYSAENDIHANWNFIGNPFTSWYDLDVLYESGYSSPVYTWSPSTNDYIAYRPGDDEYHLHPFEGLFTQNPTNGAFSIIWGSNGRETKTQADLKRNDNYGGGGFYARRKARQQRQQEQQRLLINLELSNDDFTARTRVVFNEQARSAYELGIDAAMMDGGKAPLHIWSNQDNNRLAINERPYAGGRVALGYDAREAGFVSLSAARMDKDVILYDNELNQEVDLSQGAYTFYTEAGTNNTRFAIIRIKEKEGEEAALPEVENADETVSVYNLLGQKLIDNVRRGDIQLPTGVYVIENSNGARTEMTIKH